MGNRDLIICNSARCIDCGLCEKGCKDRHGHNRRIPHGEERGNLKCTINCLICTTHDCMKACPVDCISLDGNEAIPKIDYSRCISCLKCVKACQNGVIKKIFDKERSNSKSGNSVIKCDLCSGYSDKACIKICPTAALVEGDIDSFQPKSNRFFNLFTIISSLAIIIAILPYLEYYGLDITKRFDHPLHFDLKPGGVIGHLAGIVGTILFLINLFYLFVRRTMRYQSFNMERQLKIHIYTGIIATLLIIVHSAFKVNLSSLAFYLMIATIGATLTGFIGRYLYPKLSFIYFFDENSSEFLGRVDKYILDESNTIKREKLDGLKHYFDNIIKRRGAAISTLFGEGSFLRKHKVDSDGRAIGLIYFRYLKFRSFRKLSHMWHYLHIGFTIIMYLLLIIHILISFKVGYNYINIIS